MHRFTTLVAVAASTLVLAACSDGGSSEEADATEAPTTAATPAPTVAQYASIVAKHSDLADKLDEMEYCDWLGEGDLDGETGDVACTFGLQTTGLMAGTLAIDLRLAGTMGKGPNAAEMYLGPPPSEIEALVSETIALGTGAEEVAEKATDAGCSTSGGGECTGLRLDASSAFDDLAQQLAAWGPYL